MIIKPVIIKPVEVIMELAICADNALLLCEMLLDIFIRNSASLASQVLLSIMFCYGIYKL